ncbi:MAG: class I SAM-dependent methyltransferase, partial [Deltaproteobacteria bacterium]|nr:class I SAM-dependent methyltransferase [Deltaproteobacteria bacterium]
ARLQPSHAAFEPPTLPQAFEPATEPRNGETAHRAAPEDEEPATPRREQLEPPTLVLSQDETPLGPPVRAVSAPPPPESPAATVQELDVDVEVTAEPAERPTADNAEDAPESEPSPLSVEAVEPGAAPARRPPPPPPKRTRGEGAEAEAPAGEPAPARAPRTRYWWEELFGEDYTRGFPPPTPELVRRDVTFIEESLGVAKGAVVLDLACGGGHHAVELSSRGYGVVGLDLSVLQLAMAGELAQARGQKLNFLQADMREVSFEEVFDGVYCWNTSFGYFEEDRNAAVAARIFRALRPGGSLLLDVVNRDFVIQHQPSQVWFEGDACVCMDDMSVDFITSRLKVKRTMILDDGRTKECAYSIRLYSLHELGKLLHDIGFRVAEASGQPAHPGVFFGATSPRVIILAQKP